MASPLDQFKLNTIVEFKPFGLDLGITNSTIMMFLIIFALIAFLYLLTQKLEIKPTKRQVVAEAFYNFITGMIEGNISDKSKRKFFPLIFSIFMFILFSNAFGVVPYTFTITSHISITFAIALLSFFTVVVIGFKRKGFKGYFASFSPSGTPAFIVPLIFVIEFITYLIRPFTLGLRLAANMIAGHMILKVIAGFVVPMGVFGAIPILFISVLTGFEFFVAGLQAYIFSMLTCIYLNEALNTDH